MTTELKSVKYRRHKNSARLIAYDLRQVPVHFELVDGTRLSTMACGHLAYEYHEDAGKTHLSYCPPREWVANLISKFSTLTITQADALGKPSELPTQLIRCSNIKQVSFGPEQEFCWFFRIQGNDTWGEGVMPKLVDLHLSNYYTAVILWMNSGKWMTIAIAAFCLSAIPILYGHKEDTFFGIVGFFSVFCWMWLQVDPEEDRQQRDEFAAFLKTKGQHGIEYPVLIKGS